MCNSSSLIMMKEYLTIYLLILLEIYIECPLFIIQKNDGRKFFFRTPFTQRDSFTESGIESLWDNSPLNFPGIVNLKVVYPTSNI